MVATAGFICRVFGTALWNLFFLIWRRATQHVRQRLQEAEDTILDLKRDRRRLTDRTVKAEGHNIDLQFELSQQDELRERDRGLRSTGDSKGSWFAG